MESDVHKRLINSIIRLSRKHPGDSRATLYAKQFPEYSESVAFLNHDHVVTKELDHSLSDYIQIKVNDVLDIDARTSLFKSNEEMKMFLAFKRIFSSFHIYPNVGLNNIINFSLVEDKLSDAEKNFFFKASVDLVVFEPFNNYEPIYFFELDSVWHDSSSARNKDQMKDNRGYACYFQTAPLREDCLKIRIF